MSSSMNPPEDVAVVLAKLERLNQFYDALRLVTHAIFHSANIQEVFESTCRIIVESGRFELAWIGMHDPITDEIVPVTAWGPAVGYLKGAKFSGADVPEGRGPTGITFRTGESYVLNDFLASPLTDNWKTNAANHRLGASCTIPIRQEGRIVGVLNVYSSHIGYFQSQELTLLEETASDISYALDRFHFETVRAKTEERLRLYEAIVEASRDPIISITVDSKFLSWNKAAEKLFGYTAEEMIGKPTDVYIPEIRRTEAQKWVQSLLTGETVRELQTIRIAKDGSPVAVSVVSNPILDQEGHAVGAVASMRDLEETKKINAEFDRFFSSWLDLLCVVNSEGFFEKVSNSFTSTFGWTTEELLSRPFLEFVAVEDREATILQFQNLQVLHQNVFDFENRYICKNGSKRILSWKGTLLEGGLIYGSARDVTELRAAEKEIRELNSALEIRARELGEARDKADHASQAKSEFLSRMSHELRTPLNAILGFGQILGMRSSDPDIAQCATAILKAGRHLVDLIDEILDIARIESGRLECFPEPLAVNGIVRQAVELVRLDAGERGITIRVEDETLCGIVLADRKRFLQILINLLSNAVKFNRSQGSVEVRCTDCDDAYCRIEVCDTGYGTGEGSETWLFKPFERGANPHAPGTGLGLALSRNLATLMGGKLWMKYSSSEGSCFVLELRHSEQNTVTNLPKEGIAKVNRSLNSDTVKIVYIEDNTVNLRLMESFFAKMLGVQLSSAISAEIGLRLVNELQPNLVLLDLGLPDRPGIEVLNELRTNDNTASTPVIVITADVTDLTRREVLAAGASGCITKPIEFEKLLFELNRLIPSALEGE